MDEGDAGTAAADSGLGVDEPGALRLEVRQRRVDVGDCVGDVMEALAPLRQETANRRPDIQTYAADLEVDRLAQINTLLTQKPEQAIYLTRELPGAANRFPNGAVASDEPGNTTGRSATDGCLP